MQPAITAMVSEPEASPKLLQDFERATKEFKLCPNRVWAVAKEKLPKLMPDCGSIPGHEEHELCTFDFCEYSQRDFTAVKQRHECEEEKCGRLQHLFSRDTLKAATTNGKSTVWCLDGKSMIEPPQPYMAISHVWSDGTGIGAWPDGEVNECLYSFFQVIARQFQCEGIWWDTLCIPKEKEARIRALRNIPSNYQDARITLVHDDFLRKWEWDEKTACFAILMSPWFSRGWTAVELAMSRKVKVIFKGSCGPLIKDLDEQILAKDGDPDVRRKEASNIIRSLRDGITNLNKLLTVLGARHTSWPKDMAAISGLLAGVTPEERQQDTYKSILWKMGRLSHRQLFHNAATMSKVSWCPISLLHMPIADSDRDDSNSFLQIERNWDLVGRWKVIPVNSSLEGKCIWNGTHALMKKKAHEALTYPNNCVLLAEPGVESVDKALLVKGIERGERSAPLCCQYVGALYFHPKMLEEYIDMGKERPIEMKVRLLGNTNGWTEISPGGVSETVKELAGARADEQAHHSEGHEAGEGESDIHPNAEAMKGEEDQKRSDPDEEAVGELLRSLNLVDGKEPVSQRTALHYAIWGGNHDAFRGLVKNGADLNVRDRLGQQPLHLAAERGYEDMVSSLLNPPSTQPKATMNGQCNYGQTPLHRAAWGGSAVVVKLLLEKGTNPRTKDNDGNTALHIAAEKGYKPVVTHLIDTRLIKEGKVDVDSKGRNGMTPLHLAAESGHEAVVRVLLKNGPKIEAEDQNGRTPLYYAVNNGHEAVVRLLLKNGANIVAKDGWTPLHLAAERGHNAMARVLLEEGAKIGAEDQNGHTPLYYAVSNGHEAVVRLLLKEGADVEAKAKDGWTPLHVAAMNGQETIATLLLENGAGINATDDKDGWTPLHWAADRGDNAMARVLLEKGANTEAKAKDGWTPLHVAAMNGQETIATLLLENGAGINATDDKHGITPLHWAAERGHEAVVRLLLKNGANIVAKDGWTPLHLAAERGHNAMARVLLEEGANAEAKAKDGWTPLHVAAMNGQETIATLLLENGAGINATDDKDGWTPLHWAADRGDNAMARVLLEKGANTEAKAKDGWTPLHVAAMNGRNTVAKLLVKKGYRLAPKDDKDMTPLHWAANEGHGTIYRLLVKNGVSPNDEDEGGNTAMYYAIKSGVLP